MRTLRVATTNRHKLEEIREILAPFGLEAVSAGPLPPVEEDAPTFAGNAAKKARAAADRVGEPVLADDSGLVVPALGGEPGVRSARYAGPSATDADNNALLVRRLEALGSRDPAASFVCHAVVVAPGGRVLASAEERVDGVLRWPAVGSGGFGYDPLFLHPPSGKRFSELAGPEKNLVSHRGRAMRAVAQSLARLG